MADDRAARIARIQRIERIRELEGAQTPEPSGTPVPDAPATSEEAGLDKTGLALGTLGAGGKLLDVARGALTGPALAATIGALTGKDVYRGSEHLDAINPTNLSSFPSSAEIFERGGVPEGAKMSDYVGGYADPNEDNPWYQPEKGGMLDFTLRGAGGFGTDVAIDPLTYLSFGAAAAGKTALKKGASHVALQAAKQAEKSAGRRALESIGTKTLDTIAMPFERGVEKLRQTAPGRALEAVATAPSKGVKKVGKRIYDSTLLPVEHEGAKFAKEGVGETLYNAGIMSPLGLRDKAERAKNVLMEARDKILRDADDVGAQANMAEAMAEARAEVAKLRRVKDSDAKALADDLEAKLNEYIQTEKGTPGTPARTEQVPGPLLDEKGNPIMTTKEIPASPGQAPSPYSATDTTRLKSFLYANLPTSTFQQNLNTPISARIKAAMSGGLKDETENVVARGLGPQKAADLAELNAEAGKILATKKAQTRVENAAERLANNTTSLTGTDTVMGGLGTLAHGEVGGGLKAMALKKTLDALRLGTMPLGYMTRKAGESRVIAPMIDTYSRRKLVEDAGRGSREERKKRGKEKEASGEE